MQDATQKIPGLDPRQQAILAAAFEAFRLYGFKRTSMEDIARGAGMSRAALYLHYRNKEDIFRSLAEGYYDMAVTQVTEVLQGDLAPEAALSLAFETQAGPVFEALLSSPHGQELLDTKYAHSAEIAREGEARLAQVYAAWLDRQAARGAVSLEAYGGDAMDLAQTMMAALHGVKSALPQMRAYRAAVTRLAALFGRALARGADTERQG